MTHHRVGTPEPPLGGPRPGGAEVPGGQLGGGTLAHVFLRSLLLQGAWNVERYQNVGFAYAIIPALRRIHHDPMRFAGALRRHLEGFNSHPYMAAMILGATVRFEEQAEAGHGSAERVRAIKASLVGPFAAIGDTFFWGVLRPFAGLLAAMLALADVSLAPLIFLALYNVVHVPLRIHGFVSGYRLGDGIIETVRRMGLLRLAVWQRSAAAVMLGLLVGVLPIFPGFAWGTVTRDVTPALRSAALLVLSLAVYALLRRGVKILAIVYGLAAVAVVISLLNGGAQVEAGALGGAHP